MHFHLFLLLQKYTFVSRITLQLLIQAESLPMM